jgi:hypothetical protein
MSKSHKATRRRFLKSVGLAATFLPLLQKDLASACLSRGPRRAIFINWPNAVLGWAGGGERDFTLDEALRPLEPFRHDLMLVRGLRFQNLKDTPNPQNADAYGHGTPCAILTGTRYAILIPHRQEAGGPTLDQHIHAELRRQGVFQGQALHLGVRHEGYHFVWRAASEPVPPMNDPYHAFDVIFDGAAPDAPPDPEAERRRLTRRSILDRVHGDLERFCRNLGAEDRMRCDAHMTSIRELEQSLSMGAIAACDPPVLEGGINFRSNDGTPSTFRAQIDIMVAAMASDITRAGVITLGNEGNNHVVPTWLGFQPTGQVGGLGDSNSHHSISHGAGNDPGSHDGRRKVQFDRWLHEMAAHLLAQLASRPEGDGTMLDHTVVVLANNMANGASHSIDHVPWVLAGRCGGYFRTGRKVDVSNVPHTHVLNAVAEAMGVSIDGYTQPEYRGVLTELRA